MQANDEVFVGIQRWVNRIEQTPADDGDYTERDDIGRELQVAVLAAVAITYWVDHAIQEVRVLRIEPL